jgi:hypothetical protein
MFGPPPFLFSASVPSRLLGRREICLPHDEMIALAVEGQPALMKRRKR